MGKVIVLFGKVGLKTDIKTWSNIRFWNYCKKWHNFFKQTCLLVKNGDFRNMKGSIYER